MSMIPKAAAARMLCPACGANQAHTKRRLIWGAREMCGSCGRQLRIHRLGLVNGLIGGGLSVLVPTSLFLAWAYSSWVWLLIPLGWLIVLELIAYVFLPLRIR
jgi:hypothetical protein